MRVGILTFHFNYNYGAVLQAYASVQALRSLGHDPEIVNYVPRYFRAEARHLRGLGIRNGRWRTAIPERLREMPRRMRFDEFRRQYLPLSTPIDEKDLSTLSRHYDAFYVGSDQVWNLKWMRGFDGFYFTDFLSGESVPVVAYAPCFGDANQETERLECAKPLVERFRHIGVRNQLTADILQKMGISSSRVLDPTFLHSFGEFSERKVSKVGYEYILTYALNPADLALGARICSELRERCPDAEIVFIGNDRIRMVPWADKCLAAVSPADWVSLISNAAAVVTDSFHGAIFSMKFSRVLRAYSSGWRAARLIDLFKLFDVPLQQDHSGCCLWSVDPEDGYNGVDQAADLLKRQSLEWLDYALSDIARIQLSK